MQAERKAVEQSLFRWTRDRDPRWQEMLDGITPRNTGLSWLWLEWEPGDLWEPVQRWFIWQMRPVARTNPEILHALKGPNPRSRGHYCAPGWCNCPKNTGLWRDSANPLVDRMTWEVFQKTGCYGTRWWAIQGNRGGHKYRMDPLESRISRMHGGPKDTPIPGDLPYAELDLRTVNKIAQLDRLKVHKGVIRYCDRKHEQMDQEEQQAKLEAQAEVWKWLQSQTEQTYDSISKKDWKEFREAIPVAVGDRDTTDYERAEEQFITQIQ